jgi:hypothetical protein
MINGALGWRLITMKNGRSKFAFATWKPAATTGETGISKIGRPWRQLLRTGEMNRRPPVINTCVNRLNVCSPDIGAKRFSVRQADGSLLDWELLGSSTQTPDEVKFAGQPVQSPPPSP